MYVHENVMPQMLCLRRLLFFYAGSRSIVLFDLLGIRVNRQLLLEFNLEAELDAIIHNNRSKYKSHIILEATQR